MRAAGGERKEQQPLRWHLRQTSGVVENRRRPVEVEIVVWFEQRKESSFAQRREPRSTRSSGWGVVSTLVL
ncbi:hypothetical protein FHX39_002132 [Friedmanniella antarctica]|uniref:Uncharacterized protein n=1 Tax=Microlunatus antarcticus TaxID=53388 RepID=A0A7W5P770_9ACTN|nr:hypothetical protein [Microlunatus antarcticus]